MEAADPWRQVLRDALGENVTQPVVGTRFRSAVDTAAAKHGLQFPPSNEPDLRFIELIQRHSDVVSIHRRPGQDFLVVPAGRSDLVAGVTLGRLYRIREDLFEAFTIITADGEGRPYYDKELDKVVWKKWIGAPVGLPDSLVAIDPATLQGEIELRRDFVASLPQQSDARSRLSEALTTPRPLQSFGRVVKEVGVQREWHTFRSDRLLLRIQSWAKDHGIEWKDAWLTEGSTREPSLRPKNLEVLASASTRSERDPLQVLFSGLDAADIQRIAIPLDLVLKAISLSRKP